MIALLRRPRRPDHTADADRLAEFAAVLGAHSRQHEESRRLPACLAEWAQLELADAARVMERGGDLTRSFQILSLIDGAFGALERAETETTDEQR